MRPIHEFEIDGRQWRVTSEEFASSLLLRLEFGWRSGEGVMTLEEGSESYWAPCHGNGSPCEWGLMAEPGSTVIYVRITPWWPFARPLNERIRRARDRLERKARKWSARYERAQAAIAEAA